MSNSIDKYRNTNCYLNFNGHDTRCCEGGEERFYSNSQKAKENPKVQEGIGLGLKCSRRVQDGEIRNVLQHELVPNRLTLFSCTVNLKNEQGPQEYQVNYFCDIERGLRSVQIFSQPASPHQGSYVDIYFRDHPVVERMDVGVRAYLEEFTKKNV